MAMADETGQGAEETQPLFEQVQEEPQRCSKVLPVCGLAVAVILFSVLGIVAWSRRCLPFTTDHHRTSMDLSTTTAARTTAARTTAATTTAAPTVQCPPGRSSGRQFKWANHPELCIATGPRADNGSPVSLAPCQDGDPQQLFVFSGDVDTIKDHIRLASNPELCLDIKGHGAVNGNIVQVRECVEGDADQHFVIQDTIRWSTHQEVCLDVRDHEARPGRVIQSSECIAGNTNQHLTAGPVQCLDLAPPPSTTTSTSSTGWMQCPGEVTVSGYGTVQVVNTLDSPSKVGGSGVVASMTGRSYFGDSCAAGHYDNNQYVALKLLGKRIRFTTDVSGAQCGCNAAFYLTSMHQNSNASTCDDYYCDANNVCGVRCAEIDIMAANMGAFHSTLHAEWDGAGKSMGVGGVANTWTISQYGPEGTCINTSKPFEVSAGFPVDSAGTLMSMDIQLTQNECSLFGSVAGYSGKGHDLMSELARSLDAGMTPVMSYWKSDGMGWLDGHDNPCTEETPDTCAETVSFHDFVVEDCLSAGPAQCLGPAPSLAPPPSASSGSWGQCPGQVTVSGYGTVQVVNDGYNRNKVGDSGVVAHMTGRSYFGDSCTAGHYDNNQYLALKLLGKRIRFTTDVSGAKCGCNAAFYLTSMQQNTNVSTCHDYYCDANSVCGVRCAEIDIMEANVGAFHYTLHTERDGAGKAGGIGGLMTTWSTSQYGPGGTCIDTRKPFEVSAGFPVDFTGTLTSMDIQLTQNGCSLSGSVKEYWDEGQDLMPELQRSLDAGMTPIMSYWKSDGMGWLDGDNNPCAEETPRSCAETASFYDIAVEDYITADTKQHLPAGHVQCPGQVKVSGYGTVQVVNPRISLNKVGGSGVVAHMGGGSFFGHSCTAGHYDNNQYLALKLLGKRIRFKTDVSGAQCGCNAAFYLTAMPQNTNVSTCYDYYCDANSVCGVSCAEIDIMEANMRAFHSTLHAEWDGVGKGMGAGGVKHTWSTSRYGHGGTCIDTRKPFEVSAAFPVDSAGTLKSMHVQLTQNGCSLSGGVSKYRRKGHYVMRDLTRSLEAGMTPVLSYWNSTRMGWLDGHKNPCKKETPGICAETVSFYDFAVEDLHSISA